ncbi:MAG: pitrilysin family protein [Bacilli bacterium]|nr:pitrilysin family protein [Bacilli bacterium]
MNKTEIKKIDLSIYNEKLENGLDVYIIPKNTVNDIYVTFTAKYGSINTEFIPYGETEFYKSPSGIAHFLEHKLFEQKTGDDPFSFFANNGASNNAATNYNKTYYLFSGPDNFKENINYLLNFVQDPYFTDKNVEKEKNIIIQELKLYKDNPFRLGFQKIMFNSFHENPIKIPVIGTEEDIKSITKEDLYKCYNTFYHPSNMILTISGNVEPDEIIEIIKSNQENKKFHDKHEIKIKQYNEPDEVVAEEEIFNMNVSIPNVFIGYKINIEKFIEKISRKQIFYYLNGFLNIKFSSISKFIENLKEKEIINNDIDFMIINAKKHIEIIIQADTFKTKEIIKLIDEEIKINNIDINDFNRKKKSFLSSNLYMSESIYSLNDKISNDLIFDNEVSFDFYKTTDALNFEQFNELINNIDFNNKTTLIINPLDACQNNKD